MQQEHNKRQIEKDCLGWGGGGGDSYIRGDMGAVSEGMLMDQTIREIMSKTRPKIPGKCRQYDRVK